MSRQKCIQPFIIYNNNENSFRIELSIKFEKSTRVPNIFSFILIKIEIALECYIIILYKLI